jgi:hypothetical protein
MPTSQPSIIVYLDSDLFDRAQYAGEASGTSVSAIIRACLRIQAAGGRAPVGKSVRVGERGIKHRLHVDHELKDLLAFHAKVDGVSRSTWIARALADVLDRAAVEKAA